MKEKDQIVIYKAKNNQIELEINLKDETVWLTQNQIAMLFEKGRSTITEHINTIYFEGELEETQVCRNFRRTANDGKKYITKIYNLDMILSVGYRVNSTKATQFRQWANTVLKDYLLKGYVLNQKKLEIETQKLDELKQAITFLSNHSTQIGDSIESVLNLLKDYSSSLTLLQHYDEGTIPLKNTIKNHYTLGLKDVKSVIEEVKSNLQNKKEASNMFGQPYQGKLESIIGSLYQTFDGKELYSSFEEKAAHLLYFIIKDHPFQDGNKRIGSFLFIYFLSQNQYLYKDNNELKINDNALVSLTLLVAISDPKEKDIMIKLITNLL